MGYRQPGARAASSCLIGRVSGWHLVEDMVLRQSLRFYCFDMV